MDINGHMIEMTAVRDMHVCAPKYCAEQVFIGKLLTGSSLADKQERLALHTQNDPANESYIQFFK